MTKLYYCDTVYNTDPPSDINPLLLTKYPKASILVIASRDGMVQRVNDAAMYRAARMVAYGWWELDDVHLFTNKEPNAVALSRYDIIVLLSKSRMDPQFDIYLAKLEKLYDKLLH